jgi:hypothetical protein
MSSLEKDLSKLNAQYGMQKNFNLQKENDAPEKRDRI